MCTVNLLNKLSELGMADLPLGPRQHVAAVRDEGLRQVRFEGKAPVVVKGDLVLVVVGISYLAKDIGLLRDAVVPVVLDEDGSARLKRVKGRSRTNRSNRSMNTIKSGERKSLNTRRSSQMGARGGGNLSTQAALFKRIGQQNKFLDSIKSQM